MIKLPQICLGGLLLGILVCALSGCRTLSLFPPDAATKAIEPPLTRDLPAATPPTLPGKYTVRIAPYVFMSDVELKPDMPLLIELAGLRDQVYSELNLPTSTASVFVYLFDSREPYERYMQFRYPELPRRRAFFIADKPRPMAAEELLVFTFWGDRVKQDLRHELTHALLHSVLKNVPLWLDEGLAEYFELPPNRAGVNDSHLSHIRRSTVDPFRPDLTRLERLTDVKQMTPVEYRESWAWVHLMLRGRPETRSVLLSYLQQLRSNPTPGPLRTRLTQPLPTPEEALVRHISQLEPARVPEPTAQR